jgi:type VI secretion system protein ImpB
MAEDFTGELNESRISLKIIKNIGGAKEKVELPFNVVVPMEVPGERPAGEIVDRERVKIDKNNFNDVMKKFDVRLGNLVVKDKLSGGDNDLKVNLKFDSMKAFDPEEIVKQVPDLRRILELRNMLNDFKARVLVDKAALTKLQNELQRIAKEKPEFEKLAGEVAKQKEGKKASE